MQQNNVSGLLVCLQVNAADAKIVSTTCEPWHVLKSVSIGMNSLSKREHWFCDMLHTHIITSVSIC